MLISPTTHDQAASWYAIDRHVYDLTAEIAQVFGRDFDDLPPLPDLTYYADDTDPHNL